MTYGLQLFSDYVLPTFDVANAPDEVFAGAIHLVKLYDYALPEDDAFILHQAGLPVGNDGNDGSSKDDSNFMVSNNETTMNFANETFVGDPPVLNSDCLMPDLVVPQEIVLSGEEIFTGRPAKCAIDGVQFDYDQDCTAGVVRVNLDVVSAGSGELQLDQDHLQLADFASCSVRRYSNRKFRGSNHDSCL